jgi:hypothetical protein
MSMLSTTKLLNKWNFNFQKFINATEGQEEDRKKKAEPKMKKLVQDKKQNSQNKKPMGSIFDSLEIPKKIPIANKHLGKKQIERIENYKKLPNEFQRAEHVISIFSSNSSRSLFDR